jgi:hypothetical protein
LRTAFGLFRFLLTRSARLIIFTFLSDININESRLHSNKRNIGLKVPNPFWPDLSGKVQS